MRSNQIADVSDAALNPAIEKTSIPAQETIALRMMPKTKTTPTSQASSMPDGRTGKLAPMNRPGPTTRRTVVIFRSPRMRKASATKISSCLRNLSSRSASSAS